MLTTGGVDNVAPDMVVLCVVVVVVVVCCVWQGFDLRVVVGLFGRGGWGWLMVKSERVETYRRKEEERKPNSIIKQNIDPLRRRGALGQTLDNTNSLLARGNTQFREAHTTRASHAAAIKWIVFVVYMVFVVCVSSSHISCLCERAKLSVIWTTHYMHIYFIRMLIEFSVLCERSRIIGFSVESTNQKQTYQRVQKNCIHILAQNNLCYMNPLQNTRHDIARPIQYAKEIYRETFSR